MDVKSPQSPAKLPVVARPLPKHELLPPPESHVKPIIVHPAELDSNGDKIDDLLKPVGVETLAATQNEPVRIELVFSRQITQPQLDAFMALGGTVEYIYKSVSYGFHGVLAHNLVDRLPALYGDTLVVVVQERPVKAYLEGATRNGRVRPVWVSGFAGSGTGFSGNANITVGIMDSGVDGTHTDLSGRQEFWHDYTSEGYGSPTDHCGHGSHVAGIALGTGSVGGVGPTTLYYTDNLYYTDIYGTPVPLPSGNFIPFPLRIPSGSVTLSSTYLWSAGTPTLYHAYSPVGVSSWGALGSGSTSGSLTTNFTASSSNNYSTALVSNGSLQNFTIRNTLSFTGGQSYAVGDGFNAFRGVAPSCRWAGAKVLNTHGSGNSTDIGAAMDDMVTQRVSHNIKVVNMSFGSTSMIPTERAKVNTMVNNGIVVVAAAGNSSPPTSMGDPATSSLALTVGATNRINSLTSYSEYGITSPGTDQDMKPDLAAPGGSSYYGLVLSVDSNSSDTENNYSEGQSNDYAAMMGTSMASPLAAGSAALVIDALQQSGVTWDFNSSAHALLVKMLLCATATETNAVREASTGYNPTLGRAATPKDIYEGYGILNVDAAIECVMLSFDRGSYSDATAGGVFDRRAWGRKVPLVAGVPVRYRLTVPAGGDLDLYLYQAAHNGKGNPVALSYSTTAGSGGTENITYTPSATQTGYLVVKRVSGSGSWSLTELPSISSLSPTHGPATRTAGVTLNGSGFVSGATVRFGANAASGVSVPTASQITCTAPTTASGTTVAVVVTNPDGNTASGSYTYDPPPSISGTNPTHGPATFGASVTMNGSNFATTGVLTVTFGGNAATVQTKSATRITCTAPTGSGAVSVAVTNPDQQTASFSSYTYDPVPTIGSLNPTHGPATLNRSVTLNGTGFLSGASVTFGGNAATNVVVTPTAQITCTAPTGSGTVNVVVNNTDGQTVTATNAYAYDPAPAIGSLSPAHGPATLPNVVTINGNNFVGTAAVTFGGNPTTVSSATATQITCAAPTATNPTATSAVSVVVTNPDQQTGSFSSYTYDPAPTVGSLYPAHGPATLPNAVTLNGSNFVGKPAVAFGGNPATGVSATATQITCTAPTANNPTATSAVSVVVTNSDQQTGSFSSYTYDPVPTIGSLNPTHGPATLPNSVTLNGNNFVGTPAVTFGGNPAAGVSATATQTTCTAPTANNPTPTSAVSVVVTNPDQQTGSFSSYAYDPAPTVGSLNPAHGPATFPNSVTLNGSNFVGTPAVTFGGNPATDISATATQIICTAPTANNPTATSAVSVVVTNPDQQTGSFSSYTYDPAPAISGVSPNHGPATLANAVTINGNNFVGTPGVTFGGNPATVATATATRITCTAPTASNPTATSTVSVVVTNPDQQTASFSSYTYDPAPTISGLDPDHGPATLAKAVTINGNNFASVSSVTFGGNPATGVSQSTATKITCTAPTGSGSVSVVVTNGDGQTASASYTYDLPPSISGLDPNHGPATLTKAITINGSDFVSVSSVTFGGNPATGVAQSTATKITCTAPTGSGSVSVVVTNGDGQTASSSYTYDPPPSISSLDPNHGPATLTKAITINGGNFVSVSSVTFGGNPATGVAQSTATKITCTAPTGSGSVSVVVTNGDGQTASSSYTYDLPPSISSLDPNHGPATLPNAVTLNGTGLVSGASVMFGGNAATNVVVTPTAQITCTAPTGSGTVNVVVSNTDGQTVTATNAYAYDPVPTIGSLSPTHGSATLPNTVTLNGTGFLSGASVTFGGNAATNVVVTPTAQITCTAPTGSGTVNVVVTNADGQGTAAASYGYDPPPSISGLVPGHGPATLPNAVTINGNNFVGTPVVTFGGNSATGVSATATQITCTAPTANNPTATSTVSVVVTNPDQQTASFDSYTYDPAPAVSSFQAADPDNGGAPVTITGAACCAGEAGSPFKPGTLYVVTIIGTSFCTSPWPTVTFGGVGATINSVTCTQIAVILPQHANVFVPPSTTKLAVDTVVTNPEKQRGTRTFQYFGDVEGDIYPRVTYGDGGRPNIFDVGLVRQYVCGNFPRRGIEFQKVDCYPPSTDGDGRLDIFDVGRIRQYVAGATLRAAAGPTYFAPAIKTTGGISPNVGPGTGGTTVTITGSNFETVSTVTFGGAGVASMIINSPTQIVVTTPAHALGAVTVVVRNSEGLQASKTNGFTYQAPGPGGAGAALSAPESSGTAVEPKENLRKVRITNATYIRATP